MAFHEASYCGLREGEPIAEEDTDAPDSEEAERTGGWASNECDPELGEPTGL